MVGLEPRRPQWKGGEELQISESQTLSFSTYPYLCIWMDYE
jgi:hypothetical protein